MVGICGPSAVVLLCCRKDFTNYSPKLQSSRPVLFFFLQSGEDGGREKRRRGTKKERGGTKKKECKGKEGKGEGTQGMHFKVSPAIGWGGGAGPM